MLRRILAMIPALFGVTVLIFLAMRVLPGDPLAMIAGEGGSYILKEEELRAARTSLGFDKPLYRQYVDWIADVARGDFGKSFWRKEPIRDTIFRRAPISGQIALMAIVISWVVGLPVGIISAIWRNSIPDYITRVFVILFVAIPAFWVALVVVLLCVLLFSWRPPITIVYFWDDPIANLQLTLGPACVLGIGVAALMARMTRSSTLEVLHAWWCGATYCGMPSCLWSRYRVWRWGGYWADQSPWSGRSWCLAWARPWSLPSENGIG
jgi:peptide/nickel transport system permease protein